MSFVIVTHELASIFRIADRVVYLNAASHTMTALGPPQQASIAIRPAGPWPA